LDLANDKNGRSPGARAFLARLGLQSHPQLGIFAKFAPSFAKLSKLQTPNAKPLDTSFEAF